VSKHFTTKSSKFKPNFAPPHKKRKTSTPNCRSSNPKKAFPFPYLADILSDNQLTQQKKRRVELLFLLFSGKDLITHRVTKAFFASLPPIRTKFSQKLTKRLGKTFLFAVHIEAFFSCKQPFFRKRGNNTNNLQVYGNAF
jgi:hypothetical protein